MKVMKRYAIVRVNTGACPHRFEDIENENVCYVHRKKEFCRDENLICTKCYYGDTKEQLINKVAQVILKLWFEDKLKPNCEETSFEIAIAKEIVGFLGVEDERKI